MRLRPPFLKIHLLIGLLRFSLTIHASIHPYIASLRWRIHGIVTFNEIFGQISSAISVYQDSGSSTNFIMLDKDGNGSVLEA